MLNVTRNNDVVKWTRFDTVKQCEKWVANNRDKYDEVLHIGTHDKDGFVVFTHRNKVLCKECSQIVREHWNKADADLISKHVTLT